MITREQAEQAFVERREVVYLAGADRAEHGVITSLNAGGAFVLYLGDRQSKHTRLEDLTVVTLEVAAVDRPDSSTHGLCDAGPAGATHHMKRDGDGWTRCIYCHRLDAVIRQEMGLDVHR